MQICTAVYALGAMNCLAVKKLFFDCDVIIFHIFIHSFIIGFVAFSNNVTFL
jgi:hypothetical protein